jgi:hypothetical protein
VNNLTLDLEFHCASFNDHFKSIMDQSNVPSRRWLSHCINYKGWHRRTKQYMNIHSRFYTQGWKTQMGWITTISLCFSLVFIINIELFKFSHDKSWLIKFLLGIELCYIYCKAQDWWVFDPRKYSRIGIYSDCLWNCSI